MDGIRAAYEVFTGKHPDFIEALEAARSRAIFDPLAMHRAAFRVGLFDFGVALREHPILDGKGAMMMSAPAGGGFGFGSEELALVVAERAARSSIEDAIAWLDAIGRAVTAPAVMIAAIYGLRLQERARVAEWTFLPREEAENLPEVGDRLTTLDRERSVVGCHALAVCDLGEAVWRYEMAQKQGVEKTYATTQERLERLRVVANVFGYADGGAPSVGRWWSAYVGETFGGFLQPRTMTEDIYPRYPFDLTDLSPRGIEAAERHLSFKGGFRTQMDIASSRLASARRRAGEAAEVMIDLAIALESLLGDNERFDFTYKLPLRGALLLREKFDDRKAISSTIRELYKARGQVVHGKDLKVPGVIDQSDVVVSEIVNRISVIGREPEWARLELTGGAAW